MGQGERDGDADTGGRETDRQTDRERERQRERDTGGEGKSDTRRDGGVAPRLYGE